MFKLLRLLSSIPIILVFLYFIPFLGICLILLRCFMNVDKKKYFISLYLIIAGVLILIPKIVNIVLDFIKVDVSGIPYFEEIVTSDLYGKLLNYSKLLFCVGIILLIIIYVFQSLFQKTQNSFKSYVRNHEQRNAEIYRKNDMEIKLKQERAKNTSVVHCPHCGADNILTSKVGRCKYCRRSLNSKS